MDNSRHILDNGSADRQFLRLVRSHQDSIYAFIFTLVHNDADAACLADVCRIGAALNYNVSLSFSPDLNGSGGKDLTLLEKSK